jgi:hypothetical protein
LQPKKAKTEDAKRTKNQNEHVVQEHIHGRAGLNNHLIQMKIMNAETKEIEDPRRIINGDEMPQFLDYATGAGETYLGVRGQALAVAETQNRETATVDMYADLSGFLYGFHAIIGRKHLTESMADCFVTHWHSGIGIMIMTLTILVLLLVLMTTLIVHLYIHIVDGLYQYIYI